MQTPSHVAFSLFLWRKVPDWRAMSAVLVGSVLPDISMFVFYAYQKAMGSSESDIWQQLYFTEHWQLFFDVFNSIPIYLVLALIGYFGGRRGLYLVSASALVHVLCDLPVHNDDAHRHFLPLSHWRFISPVSYWDPRHFGVYAMVTEFLVAITACVSAAQQKHATSIRVAAWFIFSMYMVAIVAALWFWSRTGFALPDYW